MSRKRPALRASVPLDAQWLAAYAHPDKPNTEVTVRTHDEPAERRMFLVAGGTTLLHLVRVERINTTKESETKMANATRKRPKRSSGKKSQREREAPAVDDDDDLDVDDLDDLDIDDLDDLDIDDLDDLDIGDEIEDDADDSDDDDDFEDDDADDDDDEIEDEADDDDLGDLDDLDEDEEEPEPPKRRKRAPAKAKAKAPAKAAANGDKPLSDAQQKMLRAAVKNKNGAKVTNIGQQRTADALRNRKLVKWVDRDKDAVEATKAGVAFLDGGGGKAKAASASKSSGTRSQRTKQAQRSAGKSSGNGLPKGMVGVARIAKAAGGVHEETVRRVLRMNDDLWQPVDGRWQFTKEEAREVVREVKQYIKYTGGKRGRPAGATTQLPDGKVGPSTIAEMAGVHRNTVYNFLRRHEDRFERFKNDDGMYLFTEGQAQKVADKIAS